jgi:hypothetical protein
MSNVITAASDPGDDRNARFGAPEPVNSDGTQPEREDLRSGNDVPNADKNHTDGGTPPTPPDDSDRLYLPSATYKICRSARRIFTALAIKFIMFVHGGVTVEIAWTGKNRAELREVTPSMARSRFELAGELWRDGTDNHGKKISRPSRCSEDNAKALLATIEAQELLPPIAILSNSPILIVDEKGAPQILGYGYHRNLGGVHVSERLNLEPPMPVEVAAKALTSTLGDFRFPTRDDKARAIAAMLTPAIVYGQLLPEAKIPLFIFEADRSQTGKGHLVELIASLYGEELNIVVPRNGGVGSPDEDFNAALVKGRSIIVLDNLRGQLDSMHIESFLTAPNGRFMARTFRRAPADIDPRRYVIFATSNGFKTTPDMENRAIRIALLKQREGYEFRRFRGNVLTYISAHRAFYLRCIYSIMSEWIRQGRPGTRETRHSFREWTRAMDWILQNIFRAHISGRLMDYDRLPDGGTDLAADLGFGAPENPPRDAQE